MNGSMRVLVVEDEQQLATAIAEGLRQYAMAVDLAFDGAGALEKVMVNTYDVVVLDRDLPKMHGDEVCTRMMEMKLGSRVLMLTAASAAFGTRSLVTKPKSQSSMS